MKKKDITQKKFNAEDAGSSMVYAERGDDFALTIAEFAPRQERDGGGQYPASIICWAVRGRSVPDDDMDCFPLTIDHNALTSAGICTDAEKIAAAEAGDWFQVSCTRTETRHSDRTNRDYTVRSWEARKL